VPALGAAVAARAAVALTEQAGIPAMSVARLLATDHRAKRAGLPGVVPAAGVLVVDEAGMLGTRHLAQLLEVTTRAGGKLVLVGDHRQLPELAAGGTFRALARELPAVTLTENRRQAHSWERAALDELRAGDVTAGVDAYAAAGRITTYPTATPNGTPWFGPGGTPPGPGTRRKR
jgi:ATP-dependent exoDNAse (exonuclease V) alpha subunit